MQGKLFQRCTHLLSCSVLSPPRTLNEHWCIYSCLQSTSRENWFHYVRRVYATTINFPCIITLGSLKFKSSSLHFVFVLPKDCYYCCRRIRSLVGLDYSRTVKQIIEPSIGIRGYTYRVYKKRYFIDWSPHRINFFIFYFYIFSNYWYQLAIYSTQIEEVNTILHYLTFVKEKMSKNLHFI